MEGVREVRGCFATANDAAKSKKPIILEEYPGTIWLDACSYARGMTPDQARFLALQLKQLADKMDPSGHLKSPAAVAAGVAGGNARAASMSPEARSECARQAATARWAKKREGK